jgi:hypothetical protein
MITIQGRTTVTEDGKLIIDVPAEVGPGEHQYVIVIDQESKEKSRGRIVFSVFDVGPWPENLSLRREDMYDEWGR